MANVLTTARKYNRSTADRQEGFNGFSKASATYEVLEINGSFTDPNAAGGSGVIELPFTAYLKNTPLLERYNVSARKGEPVTFSETVIASSLNTESLLQVDPTADLGTTLVFCGSNGDVAAEEFTANIALTYDGPWVCENKVYVWPRRATGSITLYGDDAHLEESGEDTYKFPFTNGAIKVAVDVEEEGTDYTLNYGDRYFVTYRIINAGDLPSNTPITL